MFTGIIEEIGIVENIQRGDRSMILTVQAKKVLEGTKIGDSISTNGICLTVTSLTDTSFSADIMPETFDRTSLEQLTIGMRVNLERALTLNKPLGGHMVQGHIDGIGLLKSIASLENSLLLKITAPPSLLKYIVEKGSIALEGTSLTVVTAGSEDFTVSLIPQTMKDTILLDRKIGEKINIETDIIGKYVERLLSFQEEKKEKITEEFLGKYGFL